MQLHLGNSTKCRMVACHEGMCSCMVHTLLASVMGSAYANAGVVSAHGQSIIMAAPPAMTMPMATRTFV